MDLPHIAADPDFRSVLEECDRVLKSKGNDYTQRQPGDKGRLKNFYRNGERLGLPAVKILALYLNKHLDAIETFVRHGQVESEPIEGRIVDAVNYLLLLAKLVRVEARENSEVVDALKLVMESAPCVACLSNPQDPHASWCLKAVPLSTRIGTEYSK